MRHTLLFTALLSLFILCSCGGSSVQPVSFDEAAKFSKEIDSSINFKNPRLFTQLIDMKTLGKRVQENSMYKNSKAITKGIADGLQKTNIGAEIIKTVQKKGKFELAKHYEKDKVQHLIFRVYSEEGLNYHDYELVKRDGKVAIADFYIYMAGENFSSLLGNLLNLMDKPEAGKDDEDYQAMIQVQKIRQTMASDPQEAKRMFDALPQKFRDQKTIQLMGIRLAAALDDETYLSHLQAFEKKFPDEANTHLVLLDAAILGKDYDKALLHINKIDELINKDPFLDYYRALVYNLKEEPARAREHLERLVSKYPDFEAGQLELIANYLAAGDSAKARQSIETYRKNPDFDKNLLERVLMAYPGVDG